MVPKKTSVDSFAVSVAGRNQPVITQLLPSTSCLAVVTDTEEGEEAQPSSPHEERPIIMAGAGGHSSFLVSYPQH